jgi:transcription termination factor Rho
VNRSLSDSWRFNDAGAQALEAHVLSYCKRKMQYEEESQPAPRDRALKEVLDLISPIGNGEYALLTRTRTAKRQPFPTLRGPND